MNSMRWGSRGSMSAASRSKKRRAVLEKTILHKLAELAPG
jgi:hypothetical protein